MDPKRYFLIGAAFAGAVLFLYGPGLVRWAELKIQKIQLEEEIARLRAENQRLLTEVRRLREDPQYAESVARKQMNLARPDETVIKLKKASPTPQPRPTSSKQD